MYIYLDESGNFTRGKEPYFIVGGFITNEPRRTAKAFRKWQYAKFPKNLRYKNEVKFTEHSLREELRLKTIEHFSKLGIKIFYTFLKKSNIPLEYRRKKTLESGLLYTEIVAETLHLLLPTTDLELRELFKDYWENFSENKKPSRKR